MYAEYPIIFISGVIMLAAVHTTRGVNLSTAKHKVASEDSDL